MARESILQTKILNDLRSRGKFCVAFKVMKCSEDGVPDVFFSMEACGPVFIETKDEFDGVLSKKQEDMIKDLNDCGCKAFVCWSWTQWVQIKKGLGIG